MNTLKKLVLLAAPLTAAACQTTTPTAAIDTSCRAFAPITWSSRDTPMTIKQLREHNAAWDTLCPGN